MNTQISLRAMALASVCLAPLAAFADEASPNYNNEAELGFRWQSQGSPVYGRYNGLTEKGFYALGGFDLNVRGLSSPVPNFFFHADGSDIDVNDKKVAPNGSFKVNTGSQGNWSLGASFDSISYTGDAFFTPYHSSGALAPGLRPFGGAASITTAGPLTAAYYNTHQAELARALMQDTAGTRRDISGVNGKYQLGEWQVSAEFKNDHKEGTLIQTMRSNVAGGFYAFPQPVNYDTQNYLVKGTYTGPRLQAMVTYDYSKFTDNNDVFLAPSYASATATPTQIISAYSLPPSNDAHKVSGSIAYDLTPTTRFDGGFHYGLQMQNDNVVQPSGTAYSTYQDGRNNITSGLLARIYGGGATFTAEPLEKLDIRASYTLDARDDQSNPLGLYGARGGDSALSSSSLMMTSSGLSWTNQSASAEAGYKILPRTKLTLGYVYRDVHREYQGADSWYTHSGENTLSAKLTSSPIVRLNTSVAYEHSIRAANVAAYASGQQGLWYQAPMTADTIKLRGSYDPLDELSVGMNGKLSSRHYNYPVNTYGVERDYTGSVGPDIAWRPIKDLGVHLFYTYEEIHYSNQLNIAAASNGGYGTNASTTDAVHTAGFAADWKLNEKLKLGADYTFTYGNIDYSVFDGLVAPGIGTNTQNLTNPASVNSSMHSVKLKGEYELTPAISLLAGYQFDLLNDNDWAYSFSSVVPYGTTYMLTSGQTSPSYRVHTVYSAVRARF